MQDHAAPFSAEGLGGRPLIHLRVRGLTGALFIDREFPPTLTFYNLKTKISEEKGIPTRHQRLVCNGKQRKGWEIVSDVYNSVHPESQNILMVHLIMKGIGPPQVFPENTSFSWTLEGVFWTDPLSIGTGNIEFARKYARVAQEYFQSFLESLPCLEQAILNERWDLAETIALPRCCRIHQLAQRGGKFGLFGNDYLRVIHDPNRHIPHRLLANRATRIHQLRTDDGGLYQQLIVEDSIETIATFPWISKGGINGDVHIERRVLVHFQQLFGTENFRWEFCYDILFYLNMRGFFCAKDFQELTREECLSLGISLGFLTNIVTCTPSIIQILLSIRLKENIQNIVI